MDLSIIILNYNASVFLELCVESCLQATQNIDAEVIVIDNDSIDTSMDRLSQRYQQVKTIQLDQNYGFAKANNIAVARAQGTYIALVNPDVIVGEFVFEGSLAFAKANNNTGFMGIQLIDGSGNFLPESKRRTPTIIGAIKKICGFASSYYDQRLAQDEVGATDILVGAFLLGKKEVYQSLGGLDERYFMYGEDIDLSYTAIQQGYQNYYLGNQIAIHFKGESTIKDRVYYERFYGAMSLFYKKHYKRGAWFIQWLHQLMARFAQGRMVNNDQQATPNDALPYCITNDVDYRPNWAAAYLLEDQIGSIKSPASVVIDTCSTGINRSPLLIKNLEDKNLKFRFLTQDRTAYAGSDSRERPGEVCIFQ